MSDDDGTTGRETVVLDVFPHGRPDDDRPQYEKEPLAYTVDPEAFRLYEVTLADSDVSIGDRLDVYNGDLVPRASEIDHEELPSGAQSELEYVIEDIVEANQSEYVDIYNEAGPITLRLHQLNQLPGIGEKLRNDILDERKRRPFESFEDIDDRIDGLHSPQEVLVERIVEELTADDLKYRMFVTDE